MTVPVYALGIEFTAGSFTNVTSWLERATWSRQIVDMLNPPSPGQALFQLANQNGQFTPRNNTDLRPGRAIKLEATYGGSTYPLFRGSIAEVSFSPIVGQRTTLLTCYDEFERIRRLTYTTSLYVDIAVQSLFTELMSASGVRSFSVDSSIADRVGFTWYRDRSAPEALFEIVQSGNYQLYPDGSGTFNLRDRYWSIFSTGVNTFEVAEDLKYALSQDSVVNSVKLNSDPRRRASDVRTLSFIPAPIRIPAGGDFGFWLSYQDPNEPSEVTPVHSLESLVASQDWYVSANSDGTGSNLTAQVSLYFAPFAASAVSSIHNPLAADAWLTRFQVRGYPLERLPSLKADYGVGSSQSVYGVQNVTVENALIQNQNFIDNLAKTIAEERKDGRDTTRHSLANEFPSLLVLSEGDVYSLIDSFSGYSTQWRVRGFEHELDLNSGLRHRATFDLESLDQVPWLVLDHPTFGQLDNGRILAI